jgi:hypothetical protein
MPNREEFSAKFIQSVCHGLWVHIDHVVMQVDMLSKKIKVTTMNLAKRDLVKENVER